MFSLKIKKIKVECNINWFPPLFQQQHVSFMTHNNMPKRLQKIWWIKINNVIINNGCESQRRHHHCCLLCDFFFTSLFIIIYNMKRYVKRCVSVRLYVRCTTNKSEFKSSFRRWGEECWLLLSNLFQWEETRSSSSWGVMYRKMANFLIIYYNSTLFAYRDVNANVFNM